MTNFNLVAEAANDAKNGCVTHLRNWISRVDSYLTSNYEYDQVHIDLWDIPTWYISPEEVTFHIYSGGVMYLFEYTDPYDDICDRNVALFVYDSWMDMSIEEVCADIVQKSKVKLDEERKKELDRIKKEALELGLKLIEENEND